MSHIVHVLPEAPWQRFKEYGEYRLDSLADQGFVHCSKLGQVVVVATTITLIAMNYDCLC